MMKGLTFDYYRKGLFHRLEGRNKSVFKYVGYLSVIVMTGILVSLNFQAESHMNTASRLATIESLVDHGTFSIDQSQFSFTIDKIPVGEHFVSSKPPLLSVIAAGAYGLLKKLTRLNFKDNRSTVLRYLNVLFGLLPLTALLLVFTWMSRLWFQEPVAWFITLLFSLGYLGLGYATGLNNHVPAAACLLISFWTAFLAGNNGPLEKKSLLGILSGLFAGIATCFELHALFASMGLLIYLASKERQIALKCFLPAAFGMSFVYMSLNHMAFGSICPPQLNLDSFQYAGSPWTVAGGFEHLDESKIIYFFHLLLGHHGLIAMTPMIGFGLCGIFLQIIQKGRFFSEAVFAGSTFTLLLLVLGFRTHNYGGLCVGLRWMLLFTPILFIFAPLCLEGKFRKIITVGIILASLIGSANALDSLRGPWRSSVWQSIVVEHLGEWGNEDRLFDVLWLEDVVYREVTNNEKREISILFALGARWNALNKPTILGTLKGSGNDSKAWSTLLINIRDQKFVKEPDVLIGRRGLAAWIQTGKMFPKAFLQFSLPDKWSRMPTMKNNEKYRDYVSHFRVLMEEDNPEELDNARKGFVQWMLKNVLSSNEEEMAKHFVQFSYFDLKYRKFLVGTKSIQKLIPARVSGSL